MSKPLPLVSNLNADRVDGLGEDAFLRSDRVLSGSLSPNTQPVGAVLFRDAATGLELRMGNNAKRRFVNTNGSETLAVRGVGHVSTATNDSVYSVGFTVTPGSFTDLAVQAVTPSDVDVMVVKKVPGNTSAPRLRVTCAYTDTSSVTDTSAYLSCTGER